MPPGGRDVNGTLIPLDGRHEALQAAVETMLNDRDRFAAYRNPRAETIMDYAMQAETLRAILARVALGATPSGTP